MNLLIQANHHPNWLTEKREMRPGHSDPYFAPFKGDNSHNNEGDTYICTC